MEVEIQSGKGDHKGEDHDRDRQSAALPGQGAGYGEGSDLDLSGISNRSAVTGKSYKMIGELEDPETGERVPAVVEMAAKNIAQLQISGNNRGGASGGGDLGAGVRLMRLRSGNSFSADVASAVVGSTFLAITLSNANAILETNDLTVTFGGKPVELIAATYDENGNQTNTANFFADAGVVYFAPGAAGTYTITSTSEIDKVDVIQTTAFASLDPDETTISGSAANYSVKEADENTKYKVQLVLGKEKGDGDCLLAETAELTGSASYEDALSFDLTGSLAPDGDYYPSVLLTEYIEYISVEECAVGIADQNGRQQPGKQHARFHQFTPFFVLVLNGEYIAPLL